MGFLEELREKAKERKNKFRDMQDEDRMFTSLNERKLSHDERILIKSMEEDRKQCIKEALYWDTKKRKAQDKIKSREMMRFNPGAWQDNSFLKSNSKWLFGGDIR